MAEMPCETTEGFESSGLLEPSKSLRTSHTHGVRKGKDEDKDEEKERKG